MSFTERLKALRAQLRLDAHHSIERFGVIFAMVALSGLLVLTATGFTAYRNSGADLAAKALYTPSFTTSKTQLSGKVTGVYTNSAQTKAMVLMQFDQQAQISHQADTYKAFLLGATDTLDNTPLQTPDIKGEVYVYGSTGYVGVVLNAPQRFSSQVMNLVMRANAELSFSEQQKQGAGVGQLAGDKSFQKFDQWQVFFNPVAKGAQVIGALNQPTFDPATAFYQTVIKAQEQQVRGQLDTQLLKMRADLAQINSYTQDLLTTKVDGISLKPPVVPKDIAGDTVTGKSATEAGNGRATLALHTKNTVPGGVQFDWRAGNVDSGYLDKVVPAGQSYVSFLTALSQASQDPSNTDEVSAVQWVLSDGTNLADMSQSNSALQPLVTVMNNLSSAYQSYKTDKAVYQTTLLPQLLTLEANLRDVSENSSVSTGTTNKPFLTTY